MNSVSEMCSHCCQLFENFGNYDFNFKSYISRHAVHGKPKIESGLLGADKSFYTLVNYWRYHWNSTRPHSMLNTVSTVLS